jgi:hypothetical protein
MEETKTIDNKETFTLDEILVMLDGSKYYSNDQIMYVYHSVNGRADEAALYKELCLEQVEKENKKYGSFKTEDEIKKMSIIDDNDEKPVKLIKQKNIKL